MRSLPTAYIALQGSRVRLDQGTLVIERPDVAARRIPLGQIGAVVLLGAVDCTTAALAELAARDIGCVIATRMGAVRAAVVGRHGHRGLRLRAAQLRLEALRVKCVADPSKVVDQVSADGSRCCVEAGDGAPDRRFDPGLGARSDDGARDPDNHQRPDPSPVLELARHTVHAKIGAMLGILTQHHRTHAEADLAKSIAILRGLRQRLGRASSIDALRGFEGAASARYFASFPWLCRGGLTTSSRTRRPPRDPVNAALSFGYAVLAAEVHATVVARGLEPALGILHPCGRARPALALDLMEPLRHALIDRLVLRAVNRRELVAHDFEECEFVETRSSATESRAEGAIDAMVDEAMDAAMDESIGEAAGAPRSESADAPTDEANLASTHATDGGTPCGALPSRTAGLFDLLDDARVTDKARVATAPVTGVRFTEEGRRRYLALLSELFEGSAHAPDGVTRPVRALIADAVERYEAALLAALPCEVAPTDATACARALPETREVLS